MSHATQQGRHQLHGTGSSVTHSQQHTCDVRAWHSASKASMLSPLYSPCRSRRWCPLTLQRDHSGASRSCCFQHSLSLSRQRLAPLAAAVSQGMLASSSQRGAEAAAVAAAVRAGAAGAAGAAQAVAWPLRQVRHPQQVVLQPLCMVMKQPRLLAAAQP